MNSGIKQEKKFTKVIGHWNPSEPSYVKEENIIVGECAVLQLADGRVVRTSPVTNFFCAFHGTWTINTANSVYRN